MTQLTKEAVGLLLEAYAANTRHAHHTFMTTDEVPNVTVAVGIENDSAVHEHVEALVAAGMIYVEDNDDPTTRDTEPRVMQLTDRAVVWCVWMLNRKHFARIEATGIFPDTNLDDALEVITTGLFS